MYKNKTGELIEYQNRLGFVRRHVKIHHTTCANERRLRSACASAHADQSLPCLHSQPMDFRKSLSEK